MILWQEQQLDLLKAIPRNSFWDGFFLCFNSFDSFVFVLFAVIFVWKCIDEKIGIRFFYLMIFSFFLNVLCKNIFSSPRPCQIDPSFALMCLPSFGFPSGAAQSATIYFGLTCIETSKKIYIFLSLLFSLLLCFSRLYLGVHFFTDILGGIAIGFVCVLIYKYLFPQIKKFSLTLASIFSFLMLFVSPSIFTPVVILILSVTIFRKIILKKWICPVYTSSKAVNFFTCFMIGLLTLFIPSNFIIFKILSLSLLGFSLALLNIKPKTI